MTSSVTPFEYELGDCIGRQRTAYKKALDAIEARAPKDLLPALGELETW